MSTAEFCYLFRFRGRTENPKGLILIAVLSTLSFFFFFFPWPNHQSAFYYPHFTEEETGSEILDHFQGTHSWYLAELEFEFISNKIQFLKHYFIFQKAVTVRMKRREKTSKTFLRRISRKQLLRGGIKRKAKDKLESHYAT